MSSTGLFACECHSHAAHKHTTNTLLTMHAACTHRDCQGRNNTNQIACFSPSAVNILNSEGHIIVLAGRTSDERRASAIALIKERGEVGGPKAVWPAHLTDPGKLGSCHNSNNIFSCLFLGCGKQFMSHSGAAQHAKRHDSTWWKSQSSLLGGCFNMTSNVSQAEMQRVRSEREARRSDKRRTDGKLAHKCSVCTDKSLGYDRRLSSGGCGLCATCEKRRTAQATDNDSDSAQPARKRPRATSIANANDSDNSGNGSEEAGSLWVSIGVSVRIPSNVFKDDTAPACGFWEGKTVRSAMAGLGDIGIKVQGENVFIRPMAEVARWVFADGP